MAQTLHALKKKRTLLTQNVQCHVIFNWSACEYLRKRHIYWDTCTQIIERAPLSRLHPLIFAGRANSMTLSRQNGGCGDFSVALQLKSLAQDWQGLIIKGSGHKYTYIL